MTSVLNHQLQIFKENLEDSSISQITYHPTAADTIQKGCNQTRYSIIIKNTEDWKNMGRAYLSVKYKLVQSDGATDLANGANVALAGSAFCLWERAELLVDNQVVSSIQHQQIANLMLTLAGQSDDYYRTNQSVFHKDTGAPNLAAGDVNNTGYTVKKAIYADSKFVEAVLPLKEIFGYCSQDKVDRGLRYEILLTKASDANMIFQDANGGDASKVYIDDVSVWVPKVVPSIQATQMLENSMNMGQVIRKEWLGRQAFRSPLLAANDTSISWRIQNSSVKPRHVFVAFQNSIQINAITQNNMVFSHQNVNSLYLNVNTEQCPREAYRCDFTPATKSIGRVRRDFEEFNNVFHDETSGSLVNETDFASGLYTIFHFDLSNVSPDVMHGDAADLTLRGTRTGTNACYIYAVVCGEKEASVSGFGSSLRMELM